MANVTYLLGAGASAQKLPTVKTIPRRLETLVGKITTYSNNIQLGAQKLNHYSSLEEFKQSVDILWNDLSWLHNESSKHSTIDTFAKKLTIIDDEESLKRLKIALSSFLSFEEYMNGVDMRYDTFFASILNKNKKAPQNIKVLSWNYDRQFEKSYRNYTTHSQDYHYNDIREKLNFITPYNYHKCHNNPFKENKNFEIIKINGSIYNLQYDEKIGSIPYEIDFESDLSGINDFERLCAEYYEFKCTKKFKTTSLRFAWEEPSRWDTSGSNYVFLDTIASRTQRTDVLVIIGYSFPFFNREVDRKIFSTLDFENIRKIYIQDIFPEDIKTRFLATFPEVDSNKIDTLKVIVGEPSEDFYLPPELTL